MFSYRSHAIAALVTQLRRGPRRLRAKQLLGVEFLLSVVEAGHDYPFEFVCHALTGYRSKGEQADLADRLIDAETLRTDLVTLAEDLSGDADIDPRAWPEKVHSVPELARRFDVSTKTIFRWHRRGLVGWRFRYEDHRQRLAFPERCVRRFVAQNASLVSRGSSFSQLSDGERDEVIVRARLLADGGQATVNSVARVIAAETGRAIETIRLILKRYDELNPRRGVFNRSRLNVDSDDQRLSVWEAYVDGASIDALAQRFGRSTNWIYKALTQMRARELKSRPIDYVGADEFARPDAERAILKDEALLCPTQPPVPARGIPRDLPPYLMQLFHLPLLSPAGERALFRKMNFLKHKADGLRQQLDPEEVTAAALDRIEALLADAADVKNQIVQANLRLVVSIAKKHVNPANDLFEIISDGNISLMRAVDKFDVSRGFKFSTYASWAIIKNFARTLPEQNRRRERYQTGRDEMLEIIQSVGIADREDDFLPALRSSLDEMLGALEERERCILRQRYGLEDLGEPQTLEQIGRTMGVSKERVRQLEARAVAKLRESFQAQGQRLLRSTA